MPYKDPLRKKVEDRKYYLQHREEIIERATNYNRAHPEKRRVIDSKYWKKYYEANKENLNEANREYKLKKRHININFKLLHNIRGRVYKVLKRNSKRGSTLELIGCSVESLKKHLEKQFKSGMTWANHGKWHIDHIIPCCKFDLTKASEQRKCFHYTNLQPLWAEENLKKCKSLYREES